MELAPGTLLQAGKYKIFEKLGQGGFGIAYRALDQRLQRDVCIKEFFYSDLCERAQNSLDVTIITKSAEKLSLVNSFKKKFTKEAQRLAKFQHPNIVQVTDTFEENNTAYFVMEYLQGGSLEDLLSGEGALSEQKTRELILPLIDALDAIHKTDLLHLDIKPANIMLRNNQTPVLIDFGISKYMELADGITTTSPVGISKGYTPLEQYGGSISHFSKATDVYSLCATIYKMLTGITPPEPLQLLGLKSPRDYRPQLSSDFNTAIIKGLSTNKDDRHQSMPQLKVALGASKKAPPTITTTVVELDEPVLATADEYFNRAEIKRENEQYKEAIEDYTEAMKKYFFNGDYFFYRAMCYAEISKLDDAIKDYTKVIEMNPGEEAAYFNRGLSYAELENDDELKNVKLAVKDFTKVIEINPEEDSAYYQRGLAYYYELDESEKAVNDFFKALLVNPEDPEDLYFNEWIRSVEYTKDITTLNEYISRDLKNIALAYFIRGKIYIKNKKKKEGKADITKSIELGNIEAKEWLKSNSWWGKMNDYSRPTIADKHPNTFWTIWTIVFLFILIGWIISKFN